MIIRNAPTISKLLQIPTFMSYQKIFVTAVLVSLATSAFIYSSNVTVPADTVDVEYSPGQSYIAVSGLKKMQLYGGVIGALIQTIDYSSTQFSAFSFAQDDNAFAVSFVNGSTMVFRRKTQEDLFIIPEEYLEEDDLEAGPIVALCFNADNGFIIKATSSEITVVDLSETENNTNTIQVDWQIQTVACSPSETQQFTVGGKRNTTGVLEQYTFDIITRQITLKHLYAQEVGPLTSITYNSDGHFLYAVGQTPNIIQKFDTDAHTNEDIDFETVQPTGELKKIRVNLNEDVLATVDSTIAYILEVSDNTTLLEETIVEEFPSGIASVALSNTGGDLFVVSTDMKGQIKGQCPLGTFWDTEFNTCTNCENNCYICAKTASTCYECKDTFFVKNNVCTDCEVRCKACRNETTCTECLKPFVFNNNVCACSVGQFIDGNTCTSCSDNCLTCISASVCTKCEDGYYVDNKLCSKEGISTWLIVVLIVVGVVVVGVMGALIAKKIKARKHSPLLEENAGEA